MEEGPCDLTSDQASSYAELKDDTNEEKVRRRAAEIPGLKKASSFLSEYCGVWMNQRIQRPESWKSQEVFVTWSAGARGENTGGKSSQVPENMSGVWTSGEKMKTIV